MNLLHTAALSTSQTGFIWSPGVRLHASTVSFVCSICQKCPQGVLLHVTRCPFETCSWRNYHFTGKNPKGTIMICKVDMACGAVTWINLPGLRFKLIFFTLYLKLSFLCEIRTLSLKVLSICCINLIGKKKKKKD